MRIGLGQINLCVGDLSGNAAKMVRACEDAKKQQVDTMIFPELAICGYPPEDLILKRHFLEDNVSALEQLAQSCPEQMIIVGLAELWKEKRYNSAAVLQNGQVIDIYRKALLPNYGVFDEKRYFEHGSTPCILESNGINIAVTICEDIWDLEALEKFLPPAKIDLIINISASPFHVGKIHQRRKIISECAVKFGCAIAYCNLVGGQDELVFDGGSMIAQPTGKIAYQAAAFREELVVFDIEKIGRKPAKITPAATNNNNTIDPIHEIYEALVLGTHDYTLKNGFKKVLFGLSGGIDSSLVAAIAADALKPENVTAVSMPSRFNSEETKSDAEKLAQNLGINFLTIPIENVLDSFNETLHLVDEWDEKGLAYENLQARIRGTILMSLSNQLGALVLTTGNKSETATGYSTLYGDTAGGFAIIKDVPKTIVYELSRYVNKLHNRAIIPESIITRAPSAELRPDQRDSDSLPDYDLLDKILKGYVEEDQSFRELIKEGLPESEVKRIIRLIDRNEYKRRQSPPGIKITPKAFGRDRRLPITNRYNPWNNT